MKRLLTIALLVTTFSWVQGKPVEFESLSKSENEAEGHLRFRREESRFLASIKKLVDHENYYDILQGARKAEQEALTKDNPAALNNDQRKAVFFYTVDDPPFYSYLNTRLRKGKGPEEFGDYVNILLAALGKIGTSRPNGQTVWRKVSVTLNHKEGDHITWPAFSSTSSSKEAFEEFEGTLYEIQNAAGYSIKAYSKFPIEEEFLLTPNTELKVIGGPTRDGDQLLYTLRLIRLGETSLGGSMGMSTSTSPHGAVSIRMTMTCGAWMIAIIMSYISVS